MRAIPPAQCNSSADGASKYTTAFLECFSIFFHASFAEKGMVAISQIINPQSIEIKSNPTFNSMEEWKALLPGDLAVQQTATKGKGLFARGRSLKVGESILTASPIALVVSKDKRTQYCHHCLKEKRLHKYKQ